MRDSALRDRLWVFTMQGEDLPQAANRIDLDPVVRRRLGPPGRPGHLLTPPPRARGLGALRRPSSRPSCSTPAPSGRSRAPRRRALDPDAASTTRSAWLRPRKHVMGTCRMGVDPATCVVGPAGTLLRRREPPLRRLLGLRDLVRLQPDADHRRVRPIGPPPCSLVPRSR